MPNELPNVHIGHRKRMRDEVVLQNSFDGLSDHRILELLLFYGIPRKDTNEIAHSLLEKFGSLTAVLDADFEELVSVKGMTRNAATLVKTVMPIARRYQDEKYKAGYSFKNIDEIGEFLMNRHMGRKNETFGITCLDSGGKLVNFKIINEGVANTVGITWRDVATVVLNHNAPCVIISHNHTSGNALPSDNDIEMTIELKNALSQLGTRLLDHIIVAGDDYVSLAQSANYVTIFK